MLERIKQVLDNAGVTPEDAAALAPLVATPPAGTFDAAELGAAHEGQVALLAAIVAAGRSQQLDTALQRLLGCVDAAQASLSDYDRWRFWHLKGVAAWRLDDALYSATRALNRGIALLQGLETLSAQAYLGRIFDTFGQILQHQGLLHDARLEFERALVCKGAGKDCYGTALTLGNLGRLNLDQRRGGPAFVQPRPVPAPAPGQLSPQGKRHTSGDRGRHGGRRRQQLRAAP
jgi:hypothetical protein